MGYRALICGVVLVLPACGSDGDETVDSLDTSETGSGDDTGTTPTSSESGDASTSSDATDPDTTDGDTSADDSSGSDTGAPTDGPQATDDLYFVAQGGELAVDAFEGVLGNDVHPDGAALTVTMSDQASAADGVVDVMADGRFVYSPAGNHWGADSFEYTVSDDAGNTAVGVVSIFVTPVHVPLADVAAGLGGFVLEGEEDGDYAGSAVAGGGDFDDDGITDLLVGAQGFGNGVGRTYVVRGGTAPRSSALADIDDGAGGLAITGEEVNQMSGGELANAGDVNGDGIDDFIIVAGNTGVFDPSQYGRTYVVFGAADLTSLDLSSISAGVGGFAIDGTFDNEHTGFGLSGAGDVNGDGLADVIIGSYHSFSAVDEPNVAFVVFGKPDTALVELADVVSGIGGFAVVRDDLEELEEFGEATYVSHAGDLDGDGFGDLMLGAPGSDAAGAEAGRAYVVFGKDDTDAVALADVVDGVGGFALDGESAGDFFGGAVDVVGDVNGDGLSDLVVGAHGAPNGNDLGRSYVVFGTGDRTPIDPADIGTGLGGFVIEGDISGGHAADIARAGDVNADGLADLVIGVGNGLGSPTPVYVVFGKADTSAVDLADVAEGQGGYVLEPEPGSGCCAYANAAGDLDGDGVDDLAIGTPYSLDSIGRAYVVYGVRTQP